MSLFSRYEIVKLSQRINQFPGKSLNLFLFSFIGLSVAVDIFTLVCISVERYIAICRPLLILKLQSLQFSNLLNGLILFFIWTIGLLTALPNIFMYNLCSFPKLRTFKCEKVHPVYFNESFYMVGLLRMFKLRTKKHHCEKKNFLFSFLFPCTNVDHDRVVHINYL